MPALVELLWIEIEGCGRAGGVSIGIFLGLCALQIARSPRDKSRAKPPREFSVDMIYWIVVAISRLVSRTIVLALIALVVLVLGQGLSPSLLSGYGPVMRQPRWLMLIELFVLTDCLLYLAHRACHRVPLLWRFHAIHHSPRRVHWTSTARMHPVNELVTYASLTLPALALGFPIDALASIAPLIVLFAVWSHSKSNATLGPLAIVLTGPRFHRWHHTHSDEGGDANFAGILCIWDRVFNTYYMPAARVPERFGLDDEVLEESFWAHMVYPFRKHGAKPEHADEAHRDHGRQSGDRLCAGEAIP